MSGQAGASTELQITPEMIEAGAAIIREWASSDEWSGRDAAKRVLELYERAALSTTIGNLSASS